MRAVVLVGGEGTRLRPLTYTTPKQMLPVGRRPMIERVVEQLAAGGVDEAVLSLGYRPHAFIEAYPDGRCAGVTLAYAVEPEPLDTAGAVAFAAHSARIDSTFVVHNGDVLTGLDLGALVGLHRRSGAQATISLTPVEDPSRFGVVPTDGTGRVLAFIEKPPAGESPTNLINAGTYVLEPSVLERIPAGRRVSIERETFPALAADGSLYAMASDAAWVDAGTPGTYLAANLALAAPPDGSCRVAGGAFVEGSVLGSGVSVGEGATVEGSVLFDGVEVGAGATVSSSVIGRGARVGAGAMVTGLSLIGDGSSVPAGAHLQGDRVPVAT
ncbi:MAG: sugar phosphate nucleotidyltransferase [Acidimicrobiales bacterium]